MKKPRPRAIKQRAAKTAAVTAPSSVLAAEAAAAPAERKRRTSPAQFFRETRSEALKITWPSRKETTITSVMVFIMVIITGVFFMVVDFVLHQGIDLLLKFANSGSLS